MTNTCWKRIKCCDGYDLGNLLLFSWETRQSRVKISLYIAFGKKSQVRGNIHDDNKCYLDIGSIVESISSERGCLYLIIIHFIIQHKDIQIGIRMDNTTKVGWFYLK